MTSRSHIAALKKQTGECNCAQAVTSTYADIAGIDHDTAMNAWKNDQPFEFSFDLCLPDGRTQRIRMKADKVSSTSTSKVSYICVFQAV